MQIRLAAVLAGPQSPGSKGAKWDATKSSLLPLLLATFLVAVRGGGHSEHHPQPRYQQVGPTSLSPSPCLDTPAQAWARRSSSAASTPTPLPIPTPSASAAFLASPLTNHGTTPSRASGARPSNVIRALPRLASSRARHFYSSSVGNCNRFHNHEQWTTTTVGDTSQEYYRNNKARACTRIHAKQDLEKDVAVDDSLETAISNLVQFSKNDNSGVEIENPSSVASDDANTIAANDDPTAIAAQFRPILALCVLVSFLSALDRVAMSIAILPLASEFHYTETVKGQIASAVSYGYAAAILPVGLAVSVASPRALMLGGVGLWSLATLGTPWAAGLSAPEGDAAAALVLLPLVLMRAGMGAAEAVVLPTMQRILSNWVPLEKKATVLSIVISGFQLGTVCAYLVSPVVMDFMSGVDGGPVNMPGWRGMFYVYGLLGLLWMVPWWVVARDAPDRALDVEDCEEILVNNMLEDDASLVLNDCPVQYDDEVNTTTTLTTTKVQEMKTLLLSAPWSDFVSSPAVWAMTIAHAAKNWELYNLLAWTPTFFSEHYGLNVRDSALFSVLPSVCGMVGGLTAGYAADYILVKCAGSDGNGNTGEAAAVETRTRVRKLFQSIALLGPAACLYLLSHLPDQVSTAQVLLGGAVGLQAFDAAGFGAATQEKAGERWAGLLYSLTSLPGVVLGSVSVSVTGQLLDRMADVEGSSGWSVVFQINAAVCVVGALAFLLFYDAKKEFE